MTRLVFGGTTVDMLDDACMITFPDGSCVPGEPHDTAAYRATARDHGYGSDTLKLCQEHELLHIALCHWLRVDSPTMALLRGGADTGLLDLSRLEEAAVLAIQSFTRAAGVDLVDRLMTRQ